MANQYKGWTAEEDKLLKKLYGTMTLIEIGRLLGGRSASAIKNRANYIKLCQPRFRHPNKPVANSTRPAYQIIKVNDYTTRYERIYPRMMS